MKKAVQKMCAAFIAAFGICALPFCKTKYCTGCRRRLAVPESCGQYLVLLCRRCR